MLKNVFDINAQYQDLYETLGFDKMDISQEQKQTMYLMFMTGALCILELKYGREELVATLIKQVRQKDILIGMLKSEIDHFQAVSDNSNEINKQARIEVRKLEMYKQILQENKKLRKRIKQLRDDNRELICKIANGKMNGGSR